MSVRMSEEEYQKLKQDHDGPKQLTAEELQPVNQTYDRAVAIDPGKESMHLAWTDGDRATAWASDFWSVCTNFENRPADAAFPCEKTVILLEAPYLSAPEKSSRTPSAVAYSSGMVAREAQLLQERLDSFGYQVEEFDPARYESGSWTAQTAEQFVGPWYGPNNEHARDAIRLLFYYNFL
mgnify:CR=1 FL=1